MYLHGFVASRGLRFSLLKSAAYQTYTKKINSLTDIRSKIQKEHRFFFSKLFEKRNVSKIYGKWTASKSNHYTSFWLSIHL